MLTTVANHYRRRLCEHCHRLMPLHSAVCLDCGKSAVAGVADIEGSLYMNEVSRGISHPSAIDIIINSPSKDLCQVRLSLPATVGRSRAGSLTLDDPLISRAHVRLDGVRGSLIVNDLSSSNGTYLNSVRVENSVVVIGDELAIGNTVIELVGSDD